jgi:hypothetical protein
LSEGLSDPRRAQDIALDCPDITNEQVLGTEQPGPTWFC